MNDIATDAAVAERIRRKDAEQQELISDWRELKKENELLLKVFEESKSILEIIQDPNGRNTIGKDSVEDLWKAVNALEKQWLEKAAEPYDPKEFNQNGP